MRKPNVGVYIRANGTERRWCIKCQRARDKANYQKRKAKASPAL